MMQCRPRVMFEVLAEFLEGPLSSFRFRISIGRDSEGDDRQRRTIVIVRFHRWPVAFDPCEPAVFPLQRQHPIKGRFRRGMKMAGRHGIVKS